MPLRIIPEKDFLGRKEELSDLYNRSLEAEKGDSQSICLLGNRGIGKTEVLKQLFNYLFWKQDRIAPFYYSVNSALLSVQEFSRDYLTRYICQRLAFEKKESSLIYLHGLSIEGLSTILEERKASWAIEIIERYLQCREPLDSLRTALSAPQQSVLSTGMPLVIMIDEFQRLKNLRVDADADPMLVSIFEFQMAFRKILHVITGNKAEIQEIPVANSISRMDLQPLRLEDAASIFSFLTGGHEVSADSALYTLLNHIGCNPFYIKCIARRAVKDKLEEKDCWKAYIDEVNNGDIHLYLSSSFKSFFPEIGKRKLGIGIINKLYHTGELLTQQRISKTFSLSEKETEIIIANLYLSGFIDSEFGVLRKPGDRVLADFMDCLYKKESLGKSNEDIEKELLERLLDSKRKGVTFEMTIPMLKEAELVAAQCLEQIGRNLHLEQDVIGQLQMALIEACINAIEHSKGEDRNIYLSFDFFEDRMEIGIESSGREFVSQESGESFSGQGFKDSGRGWGIKLMKNFTDSVRFEKTYRGTKVVLVKNLSKSIREGKTGRE